MLRYSLAAITAAALIAVAIVIYSPIGAGPRPEPRMLSSGDTTPPDGFVIHDAPSPPPLASPPVPPPASPAAAAPVTPDATAAPQPGDLDAVMARLRATSQKPDAAATPITPAPPGTPPQAAAAPATPGQPATPPPADSATATPPDAASPAPQPDAAATPAVPAPPPHWSSVTPQGTRWRMARSAGGYTLTIDLGGGQTADVHVQPAFAALDPSAVAMRVDYLRNTIMQSFAGQPSTYTFARDGSVSVDR